VLKHKESVSRIGEALYSGGSNYSVETLQLPCHWVIWGSHHSSITMSIVGERPTTAGWCTVTLQKLFCSQAVAPKNPQWRLYKNDQYW